MSLLLRLSKEHYDSTCQRASMHGGFLYGWNNALEMDSTYDLSARQLDLTTKIIERFPDDLSEPQRKELNEYRELVHKLFKESKQFSQYNIEVKTT